MTPADANQPGSEWKREGAASRGKFSVRPIATEGWLALAIFVFVWTSGPLVILGAGLVGGWISLMEAVVAIVAFEIAIIGAFVFLVWAKSTRLGA